MPALLYYVYLHDADFVPLHVREVVRALAGRGMEIHVFTGVDPGPAEKAFGLPGVTLHRLPLFRLRFVSEILFLGFLFPSLCRHSIKRRPDVYYSRGGASSMAACVAGRLFRRPCFVEVNDIPEDKLRFTRPPKAKVWWLKFYQWVNFRLAGMLLAVTPEIRDHYGKKYGIPASRLRVVPNGVDAEHFRPMDKAEARKRWGLPPGSKVVLSLGSLFPWAGLNTLVEAAPEILARHPECLFVIGSGEEPYLSEVKELAERAGLAKHFRFPGFIAPEDAPSFICQADICAAPFIFREIRSGVSSLRVYAYMACGRPVVGADIPGLGDVLEHEGAGISVPMEDAPALARAINRLLDDPELARSMGREARRYAAEKHAWQAIADRLLALFRERAGEGRP